MNKITNTKLFRDKISKIQKEYKVIKLGKKQNNTLEKDFQKLPIYRIYIQIFNELV